MKKSTTIFVIFALIAAAVVGWVFLSDSPTPDTSDVTVKEFSERTQDEIVAQLGQPIEGFEPSMYIRVFSGIQEEDFDGVDALIGEYTYHADDGLLYDPGEAQRMHSAARAISESGMRQLLENVSARHNIDLNQPDAIDVVMEAIGPVENIRENNYITVDGEVVCLPHKDTSGPQTTECVFGIRTDNGDHYRLQFRDDGLPSSFKTGIRAEVSGTSSVPDSTIYDIVGEIEVRSMEL